MTVMAWSYMVINMVQWGVFVTIGQNVDHLSKNYIHSYIKSYGQKKVISDFKAISFVFWPDNRQGLSDP